MQNLRKMYYSVWKMTESGMQIS